MIAREGLVIIFIGLALTVVLMLVAVRWDSKAAIAFSGLFGLLTLFTVFFFRDPERAFEHRDNILVSPADGRVLGVDTIDDHEFVGDRARRISIFMSPLDVHVNRIPADGRIDYVRYNPGKFFRAFEEKASLYNEQTETGMTTVSGHRIVFKQIAGIIARRIVCHLHEGDVVRAGERFGMIRFGSRAELVIPAASDIAVKKGDIVKGGETVLGFLPTADSGANTSSATREENVEI